MNILREELRKINGSSLAKNASWMFVGQALNFVFQAAGFLLLARLLGSTEYGIYAGAFALASIASQYSTCGSGILFIRYVSPNRRLFAEYWGNILIATVGIGSLTIAVLALFAHRLANESVFSILIPVAVGECIFGKLSVSAAQVFQAFEKMKFTALFTTLTNLVRVTSIALILGVYHHATARKWALAAMCLTSVGSLFAVVFVTVKLGRPRADLRLFFRRLGEGLGFSFAGSTTSAYNDLDKTMLSHAGLNAATGIYTMAYRVIDIGTIPIYSLSAAALPRFFQHGSYEIEKTKRLAERVLRRGATIGFVIALGLIASSPLIPHLVGRGFSDSARALRLLSLIPFFRSFHLSSGDALTGSGHQKIRTLAQLLAVLLNFGLNLYLIPLYSWQGAAYASCATDAALGSMNWATFALVCRRAEIRRKAIKAGQNPT